MGAEFKTIILSQFVLNGASDSLGKRPPLGQIGSVKQFSPVNPPHPNIHTFTTKDEEVVQQRCEFWTEPLQAAAAAVKPHETSVSPHGNLLQPFWRSEEDGRTVNDTL